MGLLNIFSKWKITCIILSPVQKDSELVSLFIQYKTIIIPWAHFSLRGLCWTISTENSLDGFNMKVTFFVIKTWLCCNHREPCKGWAVVNWDFAARAGLSSPSQAWIQTEFWTDAEQLSSQKAHLQEWRLFMTIFLFYVSGFGVCDLCAVGSMCLYPLIPSLFVTLGIEM